MKAANSIEFICIRRRNNFANLHIPNVQCVGYVGIGCDLWSATVFLMNCSCDVQNVLIIAVVTFAVR